MGNLRTVLGRLQEAYDAYRRTARLLPQTAEAHHALGLAAVRLGDLPAAKRSLARAVELKPDHASAYSNLGNVLKDLRERDEALACFESAVRLDPGLAPGWINLGNLLREMGRLDEAEAACREAVRIAPEFAPSHYNLGLVLLKQLRLGEALASTREAIRLNPRYAEAENNLGFTYFLQGDLDEAADAYRRSMAARDDFALARSNLIFAEQYRTGVTLAKLARFHDDWAQRVALPLQADWRPFPDRADPDRRLRLGFISPDLARHPVGYFTIGCLEALDRRECAIVCYSDRNKLDDLTERFVAASETWRDARGLSDAALGASGARRPDRRAVRPVGPHQREPAHGLRPQARADPGHLGGVRERDRPAGDRLPDRRPVRGPGRGGTVLSGENPPDARRLRLLRTALVRARGRAAPRPGNRARDLRQLQLPGQAQRRGGLGLGRRAARVPGSKLVLKYKGWERRDDPTPIPPSLRGSWGRPGSDRAARRLRCTGCSCGNTTGSTWRSTRSPIQGA